MICTYWAIISPKFCHIGSNILNLILNYNNGDKKPLYGELFTRFCGGEQTVTLHFIEKRFAVDA